MAHKKRRKAVIIIGRPGTGKTTLVRRLMTYLKGRSETHGFTKEIKYIPYHWYKETDREWRVIGVYEDKPTTYAEGTDKMSMGAQPHFLKFLESNTADLIFEGDRLSTRGVLEKLVAENYYVLVFCLEAHDTILERRYKERGSNQSATFLKGRETKTDNLIKLCDELDIGCQVRRNNNRIGCVATGKLIIDRFMVHA